MYDLDDIPMDDVTDHVDEFVAFGYDPVTDGIDALIARDEAELAALDALPFS